MVKRRRREIPPTRTHSLNLAVQNTCIKRYFPQFVFHEDKQYWTGTLISTYKQQPFTVNIAYNPVGSPKVYITHPQISKNSPHTYADNSLCLHYPPDNSYKRDKLYAKTIIPWTCEWIYYYEIWQDSGVWWGPEAPHSLHSSKGKKLVRRIIRGANS